MPASMVPPSRMLAQGVEQMVRVCVGDQLAQRAAARIWSASASRSACASRALESKPRRKAALLRCASGTAPRTSGELSSLSNNGSSRRERPEIFRRTEPVDAVGGGHLGDAVQQLGICYRAQILRRPARDQRLVAGQGDAVPIEGAHVEKAAEIGVDAQYAEDVARRSC
jgi:hypothetical protein